MTSGTSSGPWPILDMDEGPHLSHLPPLFPIIKVRGSSGELPQSCLEALVGPRFLVWILLVLGPHGWVNIHQRLEVGGEYCCGSPEFLLRGVQK